AIGERRLGMESRAGSDARRCRAALPVDLIEIRVEQRAVAEIDEARAAEEYVVERRVVRPARAGVGREGPGEDALAAARSRDQQAIRVDRLGVLRAELAGAPRSEERALRLSGLAELERNARVVDRQLDPLTRSSRGDLERQARLRRGALQPQLDGVLAAQPPL